MKRRSCALKIHIPPLIAQGSKNFNLTVANTNGRNVVIYFNKNSLNDAYNVKRYINITNFADNVTTGTGNTGNVSNKKSDNVIPAGSTCIFSSTNRSTINTYSASYAYVAAIVRNTSNGNLARIGLGGNNKPATSVTFTPSVDTEIGCIAIELSHMSGSNSSSAYPNGREYAATLSLTVNGVEWLPGVGEE